MNQQQEEQLIQQRNTWNRYSTGWKKWDDFIMDRMRPVAQTMIGMLDLKGDEHILDVASGTGEPGLTVSTLLARGKVTAIDLSEKMAAIANENAQRRGITNYHSQVCDASKMLFKDNSFDHIICRFGMMFFPDITGSLNEMVRVLKLGGRLVVAVWASPDKNPFLTIMGMTVAEKLALPKPSPETPGIFRFAKPGLAAQMLSGAGLKDVTDSNVHGEMAYDSVEHYWQVSSDIAGPIMEALKNEPPEVVEAVRQAVQDKARNFIKDGKMYSDWEAILATGIKK